MIYFFQRHSDNAIKIGFTDNYHDRRASLIQQYGPLTLLGLMDGDWHREQQLHRQFEEDRLRRRREWFRPSETLVEFIAQETHLNMPERIYKTTGFVLTEETRKRLRDFANGMGVTYEEAVIFLLDKVREESEDDLLAGRRLREEFTATQMTEKKP